MSFSDPTSANNIDNSSSLDELSVEDAIGSEIAESGSGDPTQGAESVAGSSAALPVAPIAPIKPPVVTIAKRPVSGRYRGTLGGFQIELRVDCDRTRPMKRISADFFQVSGGTTTYFGSFVVKAPTVTVSSTTVTLKGLGSFTFSAGAPVVEVTIPRRTIFQSQAAATLKFFTASGTLGSTYTCAFESIYFRTVRIETDRVSDVTTPVFSSYNTASLPSGGSARTLSVVSSSDFKVAQDATSPSR